MKKAAKTNTKAKKKPLYLIQRKQWLIVAGLVVVLLAFGFLVNAADSVWTTGR